MALGREAQSGSRTQPQWLRSVSTDGALIARRGVARNEFCEFFDDFFGDIGQTLPNPWKYAETSTSTNAAGDYVNAADGRYALTHSADSEQQIMRLDWGDNLLINTSKKPRLEIRAKINFAGATFSADQRAVFGFASAWNATLDNIATNAWFRVEGASLNLYAETDDGTTDRDDQDTGDDIVDDTFITLGIEFPTPTLARFFVNGTQTHELAMAALAANTMVQPVIAMQRDAGTEAEVLTIDYVHATWERT